MNSVYTHAIDAALEALVDTHGPLRAVLVGDDYVFDQSQTVITGQPGIIGTPAAVTVTEYTDGAIKVGAINFTGVPAGPPVTGVVVYLDDNNQLLCHIDRRADTTALYVEPDGGAITLTFDRLIKL